MPLFLRELYYLYMKRVFIIVLLYSYLISYFYNKKFKVINSLNIIILKKVISSLDIFNKG
jgi:hypothetical protein